MDATVDGLDQGSSPSHSAGDPAPSRPRSELRRVTVHENDDRNDCMTVRGIGFSWRCTCGERGKVWQARDDAIADKRAHEQTHLARPPGD